MQERTRKEGTGRHGTDAKKTVSRETGGFVNSAVNVTLIEFFTR